MKVIVIGAGAAGLAAAARLRTRMQVVVLEARSRLGGRVDTQRDPVLGIALEHGAEFVHGRPERTLALARRARARLREVPDRHARRVGSRIEDASRTYSTAQEILGLGRRDDEPFSSVLRRARRERRFPPSAIRIADEFARGFYLADPGRASALALARLTRALEAVEGDVAFRIAGGYARVLDPLARAIRSSGCEVRLSTIVEEVRWSAGRVEVRARGAAGGRLAPIRGDRAVVTLPLPILAAEEVRFRPPIPGKLRAARSLTMGPLVKVLLRFRRAPWGDSARLAPAFLHVPGASVPVFWTLAPIVAPVLVGWAGGPDAGPLAGAPEEEVVRSALRAAARGLGQRASALEELLDGAAVADWTNDPFARGGYAVFPVGADGAPAELARSVEDTLFFAGEATAGGHAGTVEGALRSGERAARELVRSL